MPQAPHDILAAALRPLGIVLLSPLIVIVSAAILLALLGVFVVWLAIVGALVAAIVLSDVARGLARRFAGLPVGTLHRRPVSYPSR